jgi:biotin carboxylase
MTALRGYPVTLVMRTGLAARYDHCEAMFQQGLPIHLITEDIAAVADPRFASVTVLRPATTTNELVEQILKVMSETGSAFAVTFLEMDIVAVGQANQRHGLCWSRPEADMIARDKARQRAHLKACGLPSPTAVPIADLPATDSVFDRVGRPCVVKPTRGSQSSLVQLVSDLPRLQTALGAISRLAQSGEQHFFDDPKPDTWALAEEYLPGEEITCDGVVVEGDFLLGGIHSKVLSNPPWFEEDLYTLPYGNSAVEKEITELMTRLARSLDLRTALLNAELRRAADGQFKVVEFSTRISGGHVYRNIRDVHNIDLVRIFIKAAAGQAQSARQDAATRHPARLATCIKFIYKSGIVIENSPGDAARDPAFRQYYPLAAKGSEVRSAPDGFDVFGLLSVWDRYVPADHPARIRRTAARVAEKLSIGARPVDADRG